MLEDSWESLGLQDQPVNPEGNQSWIFIGRSDAEADSSILWPPEVKNWLCKRPWCWERLKAGGEGDSRGWDVWMATPTQWTWVWESSGSWWCHLTISSSVVPFSSCPRSFPPLGSFQISQLLASGGYWSFNLSISPSNEHPGLISFRIDWLDLLAVQGTLRSLLQQHSSKASILCSAFFIVPLTSIHDHWKNHSLD